MGCTDVITTLIVARHLEAERMPTFFLKDGKAGDEVKEKRKGRAASMIQLRGKLLKDKNFRKPVNTRRLDEADFSRNRDQESSKKRGFQKDGSRKVKIR